MIKKFSDTNKTPQVRIAVIGAGYWGKNLIRNFSEIGLLDTICDSDRAILNKFNSQYPDCKTTNSFDDVLKDDSINGVVIATPAELHADLVGRALRCGKDVFVEKPLCLSVSDGEGLIALAKREERILMAGHLLWYHPAVLKLKELIASGDLGRIQYIYSNRLNLGKIRREENILWSFAPHDISVILGLLDEMPNSVQAQGGNYLRPDIADVTTTLLSFPSGVKAHVFVSWLHPFKEQKLVVVGDRKMIVFDDLREKDKLLLYPHSIGWKNRVPIPHKAHFEKVSFVMAEPLRLECEHFINCIKSRNTPRTDGREGLRVLSVLQQCQDALNFSANRVDTHKKKSAENYFVHKTTVIDDNVDIESGTKIWHFSHVQKGAHIGKNCNIGQNVVIGSNVTIGNNVKIQNNVSVYEGVTLQDNVFCGPSMVFTNVINPRSAISRMSEIKKTLVKEGATLGANCTIVCGVTLGEYSFIGAGTVVTKDVLPYALMVGNPARQKGWMCACGEKITLNEKGGCCHVCGKNYLINSDELQMQFAI